MDLLQALWRAGSKLNYYYTSHKGPVSGTLVARHFHDENAGEVCNERKQFVRPEIPIYHQKLF